MLGSRIILYPTSKYFNYSNCKQPWSRCFNNFPTSINRFERSINVKIVKENSKMLLIGICIGIVNCKLALVLCWSARHVHGTEFKENRHCCEVCRLQLIISYIRKWEDCKELSQLSLLYLGGWPKSVFSFVTKTGEYPWIWIENNETGHIYVRLWRRAIVVR